MLFCSGPRTFKLLQIKIKKVYNYMILKEIKMYTIFQRIKLARTEDQMSNFKCLRQKWSSVVLGAGKYLRVIEYLGGLLVLDLYDNMKTRVKYVRTRVGNMGEGA